VAGCIFAAPVDHVAGTKILVAALDGGLQLTCYENKIAADSPNAMILPVPLPSLSAAGNISLINLQSVDFLFKDLRKAYPTMESLAKSRSIPANSMDKLEVTRVGSYKVSIAPTLIDLTRLDRKELPLADKVQAMLEKKYGSGFAFIVCMFQKGEPMHPMGYAAPAIGELFVPTMHEHGDAGGEADWDHEIFSLGCDRKGDDAGPSPEESMTEHPEDGSFLWVKGVAVSELRSIKELGGLLPGKLLSLQLRRKLIHGSFKNEDLTFTPSAATTMLQIM